MQMPLGYVISPEGEVSALADRGADRQTSIPAPSLLEFHICRHFTKSLIWIEMQMPLGHILRINLQDLIGTSITTNCFYHLLYNLRDVDGYVLYKCVM